MPGPLKLHGLYAKMALLGIGGVLCAAAALVALAVWHSAHNNRLAHGEVNLLIDADLDHITTGAYLLVQTENEAVQQQVDSHLGVAHHLLDRAGGADLAEDTADWTAIDQFTGKTLPLRLPRMRIGGVPLEPEADPAVESPVVDEVTRLVGETATIFQRMNEAGDMLRVATTVTNEAGRRAIGTYIPATLPDGEPNPVIAAIRSGRTYHGRAFVVDAWHLAAYEPILSPDGGLIGMLYVGIKQSAAEARIRQAILQTRIGKTGYVYVLGGKGEHRGRYIISQDGLRDGEDIWDSQDVDGQPVVQRIITTATALEPGQLATERYRWRNPGDDAPHWKTARLAYYAPWDWVIGTGVREDELNTHRAILDAGRRRMTTTMGLAGLAITLLIGLAGMRVAWTLTRPVRQMTQAAEGIILGDLDHTVEIRSRDEIGTLARTFNFMARQLKQTMEGLRKSEEKYRYIFENATEGLFQTSPQGRFLSANPSMARLLGYESPEALIEQVTDLKNQLYFHPQDRDDLLAAVLASDDAVEREIQLKRKDGRVLWGLVNLQAVRDSEGRVLCTQGFLTEITTRKKAEETLQRFRFMVENAKQEIYLLESDGRIAYVNQSAAASLGYSVEELQAGGLGLFDPTYGPAFHAHFLDLKSRDLPLFETVHIAKDGRKIVKEMKSMYLPIEGKEYICGFGYDITARKLAEEEFQRVSRMQSVILNNSTVGIALVRNRVFEWVNPRMPDLFGLPMEQLQGASTRIIFPDDDAYSRLGAEAYPLLAQGRKAAFEIEMRRGDGSHFWCRLEGNALDPAKPHDGSIWIWEDITGRKRIEEELHRINRLHSVILDNSAVGIAFVRARLIEWTNPRLCDLFAFPPGALHGQPMRLLFPNQESFHRSLSQVYPLLSQGRKATLELEMNRSDGAPLWCRLEGQAVDPTAPDAGAIWTVEDITERKRAEQELQRVNQLHAAILENSTVGIALVRNRRFEWVNPRMLEVFGLTLDQVQGAPTRIIYPDDEAYRKVSDTYPVLLQGQKASVELELRKGDGSRFWCRLEGRAVDPAAPDEGVIWIAEDFTDRKRAEEALARRIVALTRPLDASESISFDDLFNIQDIQRIQDEFAAATGVASVITRTDGTPLTVPSQFCRLCSDIIRKTEKGRLNCYRSDAALGRLHFEGPLVQPCLSGGLWDAGASIHVGGQHIANWLIGQVRDNTQTEEHMRAYAREIGVDESAFIEAFREVPSMSREQFDKIAQLLFTTANQLSAMAYQNVQQSRFIADRQRAEEELRQHRDHLEDVVQMRTVELQEKNQRLINEMLERKRMELQLLHAQKMESIGQLAAGIAHEINTPIQFVGDNLQFLSTSFQDLMDLLRRYEPLKTALPPAASALRDDIQQAEDDADLDYLRTEMPKALEQSTEGVRRVTKIVRAMKEFSHPSGEAMTAVDLNRAIQTTATIARNEWKYVAELTIQPDPDLPPVLCHPGDINQVLLNLIVNAAHAIADKPKDPDAPLGRIVVGTRRLADAVEIWVEDNGCGIPEKNRARIFTPFFTTKEVGKGTGQGLTIAYNIVVRKHHGDIRFETETGKGTTFFIRLPLKQDAPGKDPA